MKQKKLMSFALAGILLLSGCSSKTVQEDGKDVVARLRVVCRVKGDNSVPAGYWFDPWAHMFLLYTCRISKPVKEGKYNRSDKQTAML